MSDISAVANQLVQQISEKQGASQQIQPASGGRSFESYLQQDKTLQSPISGQNVTTDSVNQAQNTNVSGSDLQKRLDQMQTDLANSLRQSDKTRTEISNMTANLLDGGTRDSLLKEAAAHVQNTPNVTKDFTGRLVRLEGDLNQVDAIMRSDKNLSPGELLALQARLYQVSQHVEVMSKVVDQMAGGIKTVLNTNV